MNEITNKELIIYTHNNGKELFIEWFNSIKDITIKTRIRKRLDRVEEGNYGDYKIIDNGVMELRFKFGIRIYFGELKNTIALLLKKYWRLYNERK